MHPIECMLPFELSPEEARNALGESTGGDPPALLLDCREPDEVRTVALPGAVLMPMADIPSRAHQELDPDQRILVLCHHGVRSLSAAVWLRRQGFDKAQSIAGGIDRWARELEPTLPRY